jgi:two-component system sensor histidine kinase PhoQ
MINRLSITQRSLLAITLSLICFFGIASWILDKAFRDSAAQGEEQRLESTLYGLLAVTDVTAAGKLSIPNFLADERFNRPNSGLYAFITNNQGQRLWQSRSSVGETLPSLGQQVVGARTFHQPASDNYFTYSAGIAWEAENVPSIKFTVHILAAPDFYQQQVNRFRQSLWGWFIVLTCTVAVVQILVLKWGLSPLQQVSRDLHAVESGDKHQLSTGYPPELRGLTENLNHLLKNREQQLSRYRNALDDLAHSLKTPLAVLRGLDFANSTSSSHITDEQVERMTRIVDYHLQRAATAGQTRLKNNSLIKPVVERLVNSLNKVYAQKEIEWKIAVADGLSIAMDENDLMELLGNLLDNAYKWCAGNILISAGNKDSNVILQVEDDGPGIADEQISEMLLRGKRADQATEGQGIGLAMVADITNAYHGKVEISQSKSGGTVVRLLFPQ